MHFTIYNKERNCR